MPYDKTKDPYASHQPTPLGLGKRGVPITPDNSTDLVEYAFCMVVAAGNVVYIPALNADSAEDVTVTDAGVGMVLPHLVRRVKATGTTATLVPILD